MKQPPAPRKKSVTRLPKGAESGGKNTVQVAVWREFSPQRRSQIESLGQDAFFDFARPLRLLDSAGWGGQIKARSDLDEGFYVFSSSQSVDEGPLPLGDTET